MIKKKAKSIQKKPTSKKSLSKVARANTTVSKKSDGMEKILKEGVPFDPNVKYKANTIGMAKGITKNMDNYESLRVDCWLSLELDKSMNPDDVYEVFDNMSEIIENQLEEEINKAIED